MIINSNMPFEQICGHTIPHVNSCMALIILIINIFLPGTGTMLTGCCGTGANCCAFLLLGILQFLLFPLLIGWVWSICTGIAVVRVSGTPNVHILSEQFIQS